MGTIWQDRDRGILQRLVELDEDGTLGSSRIYDCENLAGELGLDAALVERVVVRMGEDGLLQTMEGSMGRHDTGIRAVTAEGYRALGEYPSPAGDLSALVAALLDAADAADSDQERSRLREAAGLIGSFGGQVAVNIAAGLASRGIVGF